MDCTLHSVDPQVLFCCCFLCSGLEQVSGIRHLSVWSVCIKNICFSFNDGLGLLSSSHKNLSKILSLFSPLLLFLFSRPINQFSFVIKPSLSPLPPLSFPSLPLFRFLLSIYHTVFFIPSITLPLLLISIHQIPFWAYYLPHLDLFLPLHSMSIHCSLCLCFPSPASVASTLPTLTIHLSPHSRGFSATHFHPRSVVECCLFPLPHASFFYMFRPADPIHIMSSICGMILLHVS